MVTLVLPFSMLELRYYLGSEGESPFEDWFSGLDAAAATRYRDGEGPMGGLQAAAAEDAMNGGGRWH